MILNLYDGVVQVKIAWRNNNNNGIWKNPRVFLIWKKKNGNYRGKNDTNNELFPSKRITTKLNQIEKLRAP